MSKWIKVDGYKNLPNGRWLVKVAKPSQAMSCIITLP